VCRFNQDISQLDMGGEKLMDSLINHADAPLQSPNALSSKEAFELIQNGAAILDIRPDYEINYRVFDVPKVYFLTLKELEEHYQNIPHGEVLIVADNVGIHSPGAARFMVEKGYKHVNYLAGGMLAWVHAGYPVVKDIDFELNGSCVCKVRPRK
jgi:rhodanese-related sulfurtransferase